ncbi:unnamed protein product [Clonostachys byssicola]|uniref:FAD-binding domain-containing protein n=1 Tax=Clonostachys byssicola TaxID=160290 RepID=A0A9N9UEV5_9HYPO|nr:unnamed protein product [Clonostachys byssicola]
MSDDSKQNSRILIVGGGIAGLVLAVALEKFDIDYLLLEAHGNIAPAVGASIGLMPSGLLILDQLGCYEAIRVVAQDAEIEVTHMRDENGKSLSCTRHINCHLEMRHGYPMLFFDRQWLLQVLYNQIKHKDRILLNSGIKSIRHTDSGIEILTARGQVYSGAMVVGADGIHSVVRREMARITSETPTSIFPKGSEEQVACHYKCSFGIAQNVTQWHNSEQCFTIGHGTTFLVASGPQNRVYWFLFVRLPKILYGKDIPRYTKDDEAKFVEEYQGFVITENLTFGQVYSQRLTSTLTPLHEIVFQKWSFKRMLLVGDSAHKPNPIGGMGGNGAIESVAELINALLDAGCDRSVRLREMTDADFDSVFTRMQDARYERAKFTVKSSHAMQALFASEKPLLSYVVWKIIAPMMGEERSLRNLGLRIVGGSRIRRLPIPIRPRAVPYEHELLQKPFSTWKMALLRLVHATAMGALWWKYTAFHTNQAPEYISSCQMQFMQAKLNGLTSLLVFLVEGYRSGNRGSLIGFPSLFTTSLQVWGLPQVLPLYAILSSFFSISPSGRVVPTHAAKWLLSGLIFGYVPGVALEYLASTSSDSTDLRRLTRYSPLILPILMASTSLITKPNENHAKEVGQVVERYQNNDVHFLQFAYKFVMVVQAVLHIANISQSRQMLNISTKQGTIYGRSSVLRQLPSARILDTEFEFMILATITYGVFSIWDLRAKGFISTQSAIKAMLLLLLGQIAIGPGATWAALWNWREVQISSLSTLA